MLVDYHRFTALIAQARVRQRDRDPAGAVVRYRQALALRNGEGANPDAPPPSPPAALVDALPPDRGDDGGHDTVPASPSSVDSGGPPPQQPFRGGHIVMTAEHNQQVHQAAGDQYITGA